MNSPGRLPRYKSLHFQGLPPSAKLTADQEREDFAQQFSRQLHIPAPRADDWNTLFWLLPIGLAQDGSSSYWMRSIGWDCRIRPSWAS